jgi:hypothetical protein
VRPCWGQDAGDIHHHLSTLTCSHLCPGLLCPPQTVRLGLLLRCPHAPSMLRHRCHRPPPRLAVPPPQRSSSDTEAAGEVAVHRVHCGGNAARRRMLWGLAGVRNAVAAAATPVHSSELNCPQLRAQPQRSSIPSTAQQNAAGCPLPPPLHQSFISLTLSQETVDYSDPRRSVRLQRCASRLLCHVMWCTGAAHARCSRLALLLRVHAEAARKAVPRCDITRSHDSRHFHSPPSAVLRAFLNGCLDRNDVRLPPVANTSTCCDRPLFIADAQQDSAVFV